MGAKVLSVIRRARSLGVFRPVPKECDAGGEFEILDVDSGVTRTPADGGYCNLTAMVSFTTTLQEADAHIAELLQAPSDRHIWQSLTFETRKAGRNILTFTVDTLGEGGSWDLRCG